MSVEIPKVKDFLPSDIYQDLQKFFITPENFEPKDIETTGSGWSSGSLKHGNEIWRVRYLWGCDTSEKINALFLIIYSREGLFVSVSNPQKKMLYSYSSMDLSLKDFLKQASLNVEHYDQKKLTYKVFAFPKKCWQQFTEKALKEESLKEVESIPPEIEIFEKGRINTLRQGNFQFRKEVVASTNGKVLGTSGGMSFALKVLLGIAALYLAYKIYGYVFSGQKPVPTQPSV